MPASAPAGYDIAHIIERTCEPGGPLIVTDEWKREQDRDRLITEPGEVIACRALGAENRVQIAAASERIGRESYTCTYFSLSGRDGADTCSDLGAPSGDSPLRLLMALRAEPPGRMLLAGIVDEETETVALAPSSEADRAPILIPIEPTRAARLGAPRAFRYFALGADRPILCGDDPPRLIARDGAGHRLAETGVPRSTRLLEEGDGVPHSRSLGALCGPPGPRWLAKIDDAMNRLRKPAV